MNTMLMELGHLYGYQNENITPRDFIKTIKDPDGFVKLHMEYSEVRGTDILILIEKEKYSCIFYNLTDNNYVYISNIWLNDFKAI